VGFYIRNDRVLLNIFLIFMVINYNYKSEIYHIDII